MEGEQCPFDKMELGIAAISVLHGTCAGRLMAMRTLSLKPRWMTRQGGPDAEVGGRSVEEWTFSGLIICVYVDTSCVVCKYVFIDVGI